MLVWQSCEESRADTLVRPYGRDEVEAGGGQALQKAGGEQRADPSDNFLRAGTRQEAGGRARVLPFPRREDVIHGHSRWQLSRRMRVALGYSMAILSALGASWLILRLGL